MALRIAYHNYAWQASGVSVAASSEATGYAATNLFNQKRGLPWRSDAGGTDQYVEIEHPSALVQHVSIMNAVKHAGGSVKAQTWNGSSYDDFDTFAVPSPDRRKVWSVWDATGVTTTKTRIYFTNAGSPVSQAVEVGAVFISAYLEPSHGVKPGPAFRLIDPSEVALSVGRQRQVWVKPPYLFADTLVGPCAEAEKADLWTSFEAVGVGKPVIFAIDPSNPDLVVFGYWPAAFETLHLPTSAALYYTRIPFEEAA